MGTLDSAKHGQRNVRPLTRANQPKRWGKKNWGHSTKGHNWAKKTRGGVNKGKWSKSATENRKKRDPLTKKKNGRQIGLHKKGSSDISKKIPPRWCDKKGRVVSRHERTAKLKKRSEGKLNMNEKKKGGGSFV